MRDIVRIVKIRGKAGTRIRTGQTDTITNGSSSTHRGITVQRCVKLTVTDLITICISAKGVGTNAQLLAVTQAISFYPGLRTAVATGSALVVSDNVSGTTAYVPNLVFHRDAFAFASRPLADIATPANIVSSQVDPVTGIALRLEVSRQYKQTTFSYDILYGAGMVRKEFAAKVRG